MDRLSVALSSHRYEITFGPLPTPEAYRRRLGPGPLALVVDGQVAEVQEERLRPLTEAFPTLRAQSGEVAKAFGELERICEWLARQRIDRSGAVIAIGGGVTGDLAGFAAACYLRGIALFQVPTTLLAMVDSSVGGKTGINLNAGKNLVGAFHQPRAVDIDSGFLDTLPAREFAAGMAEVVKYALLGDPELLPTLESGDSLRPGHPRLPEVIRRCCAAKAAVVAADERETAKEGGRALLNLGHTFGHAIEAVAGYGEYLHGEAVAIGLVCAANLSNRLGMVEAGAVDRVRNLVRRYHLPDKLRAALPIEDLLAAMGRDKKVRAGRWRFVLLEDLGRAVTREVDDHETVRAVWREAGAV